MQEAVLQGEELPFISRNLMRPLCAVGINLLVESGADCDVACVRVQNGASACLKVGQHRCLPVRARCSIWKLAMASLVPGPDEATLRLLEQVRQGSRRDADSDWLQSEGRSADKSWPVPGTENWRSCRRCVVGTCCSRLGRPCREH
eukprot:758163-Hanusia_phi.AAC.1